jgi:hypothetical protein
MQVSSGRVRRINRCSMLPLPLLLRLPFHINGEQRRSDVRVNARWDLQFSQSRQRCWSDARRHQARGIAAWTACAGLGCLHAPKHAHQGTCGQRGLASADCIGDVVQHVE